MNPYPTGKGTVLFCIYVICLIRIYSLDSTSHPSKNQPAGAHCD